MKELNKKYDALQDVYGSKDLSSVYGYGKEKDAKIALVFMNPTKRNIATNKSWEGIRAQWLGTKQIWDFLEKCKFISSELLLKIQEKKPCEWSPKFCEDVYEEVKRRGVWITNLAKCSQEDARPLPDSVFYEYKELLLEELEKVNPKVVFLFGNQVSSILLGEKITVSTVRGKEFSLKTNNRKYKTYAIYYPVGNGRFNQPKAVEDICRILESVK